MPIKPQNMSNKLSIIIPVYNEAQTIEELLGRVFAVNLTGWEREVIVVDDGSVDATPRLLNELKKNLDFKLLKHSHNRGKGASVRSGLLVATGQVILIQDADLEYNPEDIFKLLACFELGNLVVFGSRMMHKAQGGYLHYILGAKLITWWVNLLFRTKLTDPYTGYKLVEASTIKQLKLETRGFEFEAELTGKLLKQGYKITEVSVNYRPRTFAEGKKIRGRDAYKGLWTLLKIWRSR